MYPVFDPQEPCPKCGSLWPSLKWTMQTDVHLGPHSFETLEVICWRCGFGRLRLPLDARVTGLELTRESLETERP